jgi:hypothetical protein
MKELPMMDIMTIEHPDFETVFYVRRIGERDARSALAHSAAIVFGIAFKKNLVEIAGEVLDEDGVETLRGSLSIFREVQPGQIKVTRRVATIDEREKYLTGSGFVSPKGVYG